MLKKKIEGTKQEQNPKKIDNIEKQQPEQEDDIATYGKMIHIFNYDGELVNKYQLSISAFSISVDYGNRKLYVLSHQPEPKIYIYDLFYY